MPGETFVINLLEDKEFDKLPYRNISNSLGIADRETGNAFIRKSGLGKEFDAATIQHEIQHLIESNNAHADEYGILHKKFKDVMKVVAAPLIGLATGGIGSLLGLGTTMAPLVGAAAGGTAGALGAGAGGPGHGGIVPAVSGALGGAGGTSMLTGAIKGGTTAAPGFLSKAGGIAKGALGMTPTTSVGGVAVPTTAAEALRGMPAAIGPQAPKIAAANIRAATPLFAPTALGQTNVGQIQKQPPQSPVSPKPFEITPTTALGAGALAGSMGIKQPEFKMPSSVEDLRQKILQSGQPGQLGQPGQPGQLTEVGTQARSELSNILKSTPQERFPVVNDAYIQSTIKKVDELYDQADEQLAAVYNQAGMLGSGEYREAAADLKQKRADAKSAYTEQENQRRFELARTEKYGAIQMALGVDKDTMDNLIGLTGLDVQTAAMMYGAQVQDVQEIRSALGTLGVEMMLRGAGVQPSLGNLNIALRK